MRSEIVLGGFIVIYAILIISFYPTVPTMSDESEYFRNAHLLLQGKTYVDQPEYSYNFVGNAEKYFSRYPLAASLFLIPFLIFGLKSAFLFGAFFYLLGAYFFLKLLDMQKLSRLWLLLYLGYTPFLFHSTTLMNDLPSMALVLGGFYFYARKNLAASGAIFGLATLVKSTNILGLFLVFIIMTFDQFKERNFSWQIFIAPLAAVPFVLLFFVHNWYLYGNPLLNGYSFIHNNVQFLFSKENYAFLAGRNLLHYISFLLIFYPGMLFLSFIKKFPLRRETALFTAICVLFFSNVNNILKLTPDDLVIHYRLVFPAVPLLLLGYAHFWQSIVDKFKFLQKNFRALLIAFGIICLIVFIPILQLKEQGSARTGQIIDDIYGNTQEGSLILGSQEANYFNEYFGNRAYVSMLRPVGFDNSSRLVQEKIPEYLGNGKKVYVLYLDTPYYSYKRGVNETWQGLDALREKYGSAMVFTSNYSIQNFYYGNTINLKLYELYPNEKPA